MQSKEPKNTVGRQYNSIDLCKFILSFVVVAIHTQPFVECKNTVFQSIYEMLTGLAVPFFFLASGYLLAAKMQYPYGDENDRFRIKRQTRSILRMYITWMLIYSPLAIYHYASTQTPVMHAVLYYIRGFILIGEHYNSWPLWYLLSTIYSCMAISFILKQRRNPGVLVSISIIAGLFSVGLTELANYTGNLSPLVGVAQKLIKVSILNGRIFTGLVYIPIGMLLAHRQIPLYINWIGFIAGFVLNCFTDNSIADSYLLIIMAVSFFGIVENIRLKNNTIFPKLRNMSSIVYLTHMYIWTFYYKFVYGSKTYGADSFVFTACVSAALAAYIAFRKSKKSVRQQQDN